MTTVLDVAAGVLMIAGSAIAVIAAIGLHRLPDVYARMHVATKPATLGITLCLTGAALRAPGASTATKLTLAVVFQLVTTPAAGHLLGRAAHAARAPVSEHTVVDELRPLPGQARAETAVAPPAAERSEARRPLVLDDRATVRRDVTFGGAAKTEH